MKDHRNIVDRLTGLFKDKQSGKSLHRILMMMAVVVVFMTTYLLILPAITLDEDSGHRLPGISLEGGSTSRESESNSSPDKTDQKDEDQEKKTTRNDQKTEEESQEESPGKNKIKESTEHVDSATVNRDEAKTLEYNAGSYKVTAVVGNRTTLSKGSKLRVKEVKAGTEKYRSYFALMKKELSESLPGADARKLTLYEISFKDSEGKEIEDVTADIVITYKDGINLLADDLYRGVICEGNQLLREQNRVELIEKNRYAGISSGERDDAVQIINDKIISLSFHHFSNGKKGSGNLCGLAILTMKDEKGKEGEAADDTADEDEESTDDAVNDATDLKDEKENSQGEDAVDKDNEDKDGEGADEKEKAADNDDKEKNKDTADADTKASPYLTGKQKIETDEYAITAELDEEAQIPADADFYAQKLSDKEVEKYKKKAKKELGLDNLDNAQFFDIGFRHQGEEIEPAAPVKVTISVADTMEPEIIHFVNDEVRHVKTDKVSHGKGKANGKKKDASGKKGKKAEQKQNKYGTTVEFNADGFSIYAIIDSSKRLQYNFYDGTSLLVSEYIKKQDNVLQELYDPGVEPEYGQTFVGWAYSPDETNPSNIYTIEQINQQANERYNNATEELTEIDVYAVYDEAWYLRYMDENAQGDAIVLNVVRVRKDATNKDVILDYTYTPEEGIIFEGWIDVATGDTYQKGDIITLDHHFDLYLKIHGRNWLVFDANAGGPGSGATYIPPQLLIGSTATTEKPEDPTRRGYTFTGWNTKADGTGTWWYKPDGSVNRFGNTLSADTTLYAQWEANDADYYVVFWKQKATATGTDPATDYDYVSSETRSGKTGSSVSITQEDTRKGNYQGNNYGEYGYYFTYNADNSDTVSKVVNPDGTTQLNVYYDRKEITFSFSSTNGAFNVVTYTGIVDGQTVILTPDGNGGYTYRKEHTETTNVPYTGTRYNITTVRNNNNPVHYGVVSGRTSPVELNRRDNDRWYYDGSMFSWGTRYTGTHYVQSNTGAYGWIDNTMTQLNDDGTYTTTTTTYTNELYDGPEPTASTTAVTSYTLTGLYGAPLNNWPDPGSGYQWQTSGGNTYHGGVTTYVIPGVVNTSGRQTTWNLVRTSNSGSANVYFVTMNVDGSYPDDPTTGCVATSIISNTATMTFAPQKYEGFTGDYVVRNGRTQYFNGSNVTASGSGDIYSFYKRNQWKINYISEGPNVDVRDEHQSEPIFYEANISNYGQDMVGNWYYEPDNGIEGYYFAGWYADSACQIPFDFNTTMPNSDITVYAKWDTYRVRVVLVPTPNNEHNDEVQFANNQSLSFRLDYNEEVSDSNINSSVAKRPGYKLIGWYYSPDFDPATEIHFPVMINKDTPGVDMNYQSGEDWNKYGDNDGSHDNVRGILKLYAKWELDVDENSVYVEYDVDDVYRTYDTAGMLQTTIPVDNKKYALTNNNVTFQVAEAPTEYTSGFEFYRWVLLNPDGSESDILYNPADTAAEIPSSFIYEETITDDLGNTATIKKIRLKAKFNIETEKVTTVTFDGNGGITNDSAQQESVTESYPINKEFLMKDADSFVREGYTLLGWAFEREDGSKITPEAFEQALDEMNADQLIQAGIYQLGQKVAADNLEVSEENNWDPLENTVYAVWKINTYTVTLKKVVDGESTADKEFTFTVSASDDYTIPEGATSFELVNGSDKIFTEVPYGTILTFTETPVSGYSVQSVVAKQTSKPDKTSLEETNYIDLDGADGKSYTIKGDTLITYTNERAKEQKLRIRKNGDDATSGLAGATFDLKAAEGTTIEGFTDLTELTSLDGAPDTANLGYLPSGNEADNTLFTLPIGSYTLTETNAPQYYEGLSGAVSLNVTGEGIYITGVGADDEAPFDGVSVSGPDNDGVYTLTVTNTRKKGSVTIIKNVTGKDADKEATYRFTATGLTEEEESFELYGEYKEAVDETPEQKNTKTYSEVLYGTEFSVAEAAEYDDFDTTITAVYADDEATNHSIILDPERENPLSTGNIIVEGDVTITYTNKRNKQPVAIYKTGLGENETITTGATFVVYKASEYNDATRTPVDGATVVAQGSTNEYGILILGKLQIEAEEEYTEYRLVETNAPSGYILPDYLMKIFVYPDRVTGMQGTGNMLIKDPEDYSDITDKSTTVLRVWNNPGVSLPATGGSGTKLLYLLGITLIAIAGAGFVMRRRRREAA